MIKQAIDAMRLDDDHELSWAELVSASGWPETELEELVQYGVIAPRDAASGKFEAGSLVVARLAWRLRCELDLDPYGASVCMGFLERIRALEEEVRRLQAQLG
jgi:hypothetical protein